MRKKQKIEVYMSDDLKESLKLCAESMSIGMATVIKIALEEFLNKRKAGL
jgi:hypothetical protein